jgi:peptidoglycan/LPS O-acetylase OafA/YrhL
LSTTHATSTRPVSQGSVHLDALRGAAALLVFLNHTRALYFSSVLAKSATPSTAVATPIVTPGTPHPAAGGGVKLASEAVVIFFVLSGYLVGGSVIRAVGKNSWSWKDYLVKRLTRLWVPLIPCLLVCMCLDRIGFHRHGLGSIYQNAPGLDLQTSTDLVHRIGIKSLLGNIFFLQGIRTQFLGTNASLWSLANEFWYYLIFPCLLLAFVSGRSTLLRVFYAALAVAMLVFITAPVAVLFPIWICGAAVAVLPKPLSSSRARWLSVVCLPVLLICMVEVRLLPLSVVFEEYLIGIVSSVFLYLLAQQRAIAGRGIYKTLAGFFSQISYTLYIVHLPIAVFLAASINSPWHEWSKTPAHLASFLLLDAVVLACATLLWRLFEANTDSIRRSLFEGKSDAAVNPTVLP